MSEENHMEIYRQFRTAQDKYCYFLLAAAASGIAFAVQRTGELSLQIWMAPLGACGSVVGNKFFRRMPISAV